MGMRYIVKLFDNGSVCVCGLRGRGKDMLMANAILRLNVPYVGNTDYGGQFLPFKYEDMNMGNNSYDNFISGKVKKYVSPYPDGTHFALGDIGLLFPSQFCNELNKKYPSMSVAQALVRQVFGGEFHFNVQNLNRCWDKIREMSDTYLMCNWCKVFFHRIVIQKVTEYELYEPAVKRVPPFRLPKPFFNSDRRFQWKIQKQNYDIAHGRIKSHLLIYWNRSNYNTRIFKEMLENGIEE